MSLQVLLTEPLGPGRVNAQPDPGKSLGGYASLTAIDLVRPVHNLYGGEDRAACEAGHVSHRVFVIANLGTDPVSSRAVHVAALTVGRAAVGLAFDPLGVGPLTAQRATISSTEDATPTGVTFQAAASNSDAIETGSIPAGHGIALHIRRSVPSGVPETVNDGATITIENPGG